MSERVVTAMEDVVAAHPGEIVVVCTHGGVVEAAMRHVVRRRCAGASALWTTNASLHGAVPHALGVRTVAGSAGTTNAAHLLDGPRRATAWVVVGAGTAVVCGGGTAQRGPGESRRTLSEAGDDRGALANRASCSNGPGRGRRGRGSTRSGGAGGHARSDGGARSRATWRGWPRPSSARPAPATDAELGPVRPGPAGVGCGDAAPVLLAPAALGARRQRRRLLPPAGPGWRPNLSVRTAVEAGPRAAPLGRAPSAPRRSPASASVPTGWRCAAGRSSRRARPGRARASPTAYPGHGAARPRSGRSVDSTLRAAVARRAGVDGPSGLAAAPRARRSTCR